MKGDPTSSSPFLVQTTTLAGPPVDVEVRDRPALSKIKLAVIVGIPGVTSE